VAHINRGRFIVQGDQTRGGHDLGVGGGIDKRQHSAQTIGVEETDGAKTAGGAAYDPRKTRLQTAAIIQGIVQA